MKWFSRKKLLASLSVLALAVLAVAAGLVYFISSPEFDQFAADYVVEWIEDHTGTSATLTRLESDFRGQRFTLYGLTLHGEEDPSDPPLVAVDRIDVQIRLRALLNGHADLQSLALVGPRISIQVDQDGSTNVPSPAATEGTPTSTELSVTDLSLSNGEITVDENRMEIDFRLVNLGGSFEYDSNSGVLAGHLEYGGTLRHEDHSTIPYTLETDFDYVGGTVLVESATVRSGDTGIALQGRMDEVLRELRGGLDFSGNVDLPFINYFFADETIAGTAEVTGRVDFSAGALDASGHATIASVDLSGWNASDVETDFEYRYPDRQLTASNLTLGFGGGRAEGAVTVSPLPGQRRVEVDLIYDDIASASLRRAYPWNSDYVVFSRMDGTLRGWFEGRFARFDLTGSTVLRPIAVADPDVGVPLRVGGTAAYRGTPGTIELTSFDGRMDSTSFSGEGTIGRNGIDLAVRAESDDLRNIAFINQGANGRGNFDGTIAGPLDGPRVSGQFELAQFIYDDTLTIDRVAGAATVEPEGTELREVSVQEADSEITVNGSLTPDLTPNLDVEIIQLDLALLRPFIAQPLEGVLKGRVHLDSFQPLRLAGDLQAEDLTHEGHPIGTGAANVNVSDQDIQVTDVAVRMGESTLAGSLDYRAVDDALNIEFNSSNVELQDLYWLGVPSDFTGLIRNAEFRIDGTPGDPQSSGTVGIEDLRFRRQYFRSADIRVTGAGRTIRADIDVDRDLTLAVEVDRTVEGLPFQGNARFVDYDADNLAGIPAGSLVASGTAAFQGSLLDLAGVRGSGLVSTLTAHMEERDLRTAAPFTFDFDSQQVSLSRIELSGDATSLEIGGSVGLVPSAPLDFDINGNIDLSLIGNGVTGLETGGDIQLAGEIGGTLSSPELRGQATLTDVSLGHSGIFLSLSSVNGGLFFDGNRINLNGLTGSAGGGTITIQGTAGIEGTTLGGVDVRMDLANVRVRNPEGLRTVLEGALVLRGTPDDPVLEGNLDVVNMSYNESFDQFLALFSGDTGAAPDTPFDDLALALHLEGDRNIRIENDLARVETRLDLDISGTFGEPAMTGHVEVSDGSLNFQGNRYRITRGNVDFVDPVSIEPLIDVQAETELRDYRVILAINGRGDDVRLNIRSDPPLPQLEIVSLMTGGRTREEFADGTDASGLPTSEQLFTGGAATILTDLLQARVGSRFGLLDRFRIDPFHVGAENRPVARITVSEQITRDLTITYSQDLSSSRQQIIQIEYFLNNDTSFIASRDETGAVGLDVKLRKRFD